MLPIGEVVGLHGCGGVSRVTYRPPNNVTPRGPGVQECDRCGAVGAWWPTAPEVVADGEVAEIPDDDEDCYPVEVRA